VSASIRVFLRIGSLYQRQSLSEAISPASIYWEQMAVVAWLKRRPAAPEGC